ncbi:cupin domain-containing protein [Hymenobacter weizhouensis]|uniref:cupin domain-containing protein n=1 Tax=Hymenobacter sp. YIM 151500-1 TaxID=2987689 RepID=UPI002227FBB3|nr:cupin domain-containing protein [Hymenobacter sp. YIM 151500-1]UYZ62327.1 cupin domain-containing protein [Hymenobacter sp. YIM 151500-1]
MTTVDFREAHAQQWEQVSEEVERTILRSQPGENRVLIKIGAGRAYPHHAHATPDEVFVVDGVYVDPGVENGRPFGPGSYLYYPPGTEHNATSPSGCTILVWNAGAPKT